MTANAAPPDGAMERDGRRARETDRGAPAVRPRDPRLDFFRGLALLIIVVSHVPANPWAALIPGRFGFSDAAEIFVFCSGVASALAFGATYTHRGWWLGTARILQRVWQVYWAHVASFVVIAAAMVALTASEFLVRDYVDQLNLTPFVRDPASLLVGLLTLTYVPNYFDILPMYLVILAMLPAAIALARIHPGLLAVVSVAVWVMANTGQLALPAEPWSERTWFFNPFGWQLLFFIGFAFGAGWLRPPPVSATLMALAVAVLILALPIVKPALHPALPILADAREALQPAIAKSPNAPLRLLHFLALAYLAWVLCGPGGARLAQGVYWPRIVALLQAVGRQSLPVFVTGLLLSRLMGVGLDVVGRDLLPSLSVNVAGLGVCVGTALVVGWFKSAPWRSPEKARLPATAARTANGSPSEAEVREDIPTDRNEPEFLTAALRKNA